MTILLSPEQKGKASKMLRSGRLVAFPTETVYGLGANALDADAVARIFEAKARPSFNPLIVHVADIAAAQAIGVFDDEARMMADAFWPGPMSLVLPLRPEAGICDLVTAGLDTIAIRVPAHPLSQDILRAAGVPIAAPSANPSGEISPTTAQHVLDGLDGRIDAVIDGGSCQVGLESTIIGVAPLTLLRAGGVTVEEVNQLGLTLVSRDEDAALSAPGQMLSHYAPDAPLRMNAENASENEVLLGFGETPAPLNLSRAESLREAAMNLFDMLRQADRLAEGGKTIAVSPIPLKGLGLAINDRLTRAAAPREAG